MRFPVDILSGTYTKPRLFLCEVDKSKICQLEVTNLKGSFKFNSMSELSFDVSRVYNDLVSGETKTNPFYDKIEALRLVYLESFGYFELQGPELSSDGIKEIKSCTAYSLEYTLSQKYIENFRINMGTVDSIEVLNAESPNKITPIVLYNPTKPELSLLHLILEKIYGWSIGHVDPQLITLSRQFDIDRESIYDFLINEVCKRFNCYISFNTINNTINIYAESPTAKFTGDDTTTIFEITNPVFSSVETVSINGYKTTRWEYRIVNGVGKLILDEAPKSGELIEVVGVDSMWETDVFVSFDNLSKEININYDADSIKTVLTVTYGDDLNIREANLGLPYLTDISYYYTVDWMGQDLYDAYGAYMEKSNNSQRDYSNNTQEISKINSQILYEENRLSLDYSIANSVNSSTVGTYYIKQTGSDGSVYYKEVSLPAEYRVDVTYYSNSTTNLQDGDAGNVSKLYSALKRYFYAYFYEELNDRDKTMNDALNELDTLSDSFKFMIDKGFSISKLKTDIKNVSDLSAKEETIKSFLSTMWTEVGRTPLKTLYLDSYKTIQETNSGWSSKSNQNYGYYYITVVFVDSINAAISNLDKLIKGYEDNRKVYQDANAKITEGLLMSENFTPGQLIRLNAFLREDELHIDDIIETSLDDISSSLKLKKDAMESGRIELKKLCQPQLQFSMTMANIYALPDFEPIINQFQLGNIIKVALRPDYIKHSRLLQVDINFDDFSDFSCEFGELTNLRTQSDIHADLLSNAISAGKSVATNASYWTRGSDQATAIDLKIQQGLLDATTQIKAIDGTQGVVIDKYGIKLQKKLDNGGVDPHQTWLVNNMILMSDDGFKTSRSALGEITIEGNTYYGLIAEMVLSGYIEGSIIKGGTIQIGEYIDADGNKKYAFEVDKDGNVTMSSGSIDGYATSEELSEIKKTTDGIISTVYDDNGESRIEQTAQSINLKVGYNDVISAINLSNEEIKINSDKLTIDVSDIHIDASNINLEGLVTANENFKVLTDGSIEANYAKISGTISGSDFIGGSITIGDKFNVSNDGIMTCSGANIIDGYININNKFIVDAQGNVTIPSGTIKIGDVDGSSDLAKITDVPTKLSELNNDTGYQTSSQVTTITENTIQTTSVVAKNLQVSAANVAGTLTAAEISVNQLRAGSNNEVITFNGAFTAPKATITGSITATSGKIGTWEVVAENAPGNDCGVGLLGSAFYTTTLGNGGYYGIGFDCRKEAFTSPNPWNVLAIGQFEPNELGNTDTEKGLLGKWGTAAFRVQSDGVVNCSNINATGGTVGGWNIYRDYLSSTPTEYDEDGYGMQYAILEPTRLVYIYNESVGTGIIASWNNIAQCVKEWIDTNSYESDANVKNTISTLEQAYDNLFDNLSPCKYKYNHGTSDRFHTGFIAQEVVEAIENSGLTTQDFAGVVHLNEPNVNGCEWLLRRDEFVALNTWQIQKLKKRVAELEAKLESLQ